MKSETESSVHWSFWLIAGLGLIWYAMGCVNFFTQMNPETVASYPESHRTIIEGRPVWATMGFGLAVFGGALLLLLRKSAAFYVFVAALVGVIVQLIHTVSSGADFSAFDMLSIILMPLAVAAFFIWYSKYSASKGWIS